MIRPAGAESAHRSGPAQRQRRRDQQEDGADREQQDPDAGVAAVEDGAPEEEAGPLVVGGALPAGWVEKRRPRIASATEHRQTAQTSR